MKVSVELLPVDAVAMAGKALPEKFSVMFGVKMLLEERRQRMDLIIDFS